MSGPYGDPKMFWELLCREESNLAKESPFLKLARKGVRPMKVTVITECERCGEKQTDEFESEYESDMAQSVALVLSARIKKKTEDTHRYLCDACFSEYQNTRTKASAARAAVMRSFWDNNG